ncbi:hypothetical protein [Mucilaginibacter flavidus]|uniref:hypothetical protein n=1 Tax=Mucilaginibacter flavidus TaxID=2949309 RepID=UPI002092C7DE|nr:hypothetical protein [Mucilaginibacter flavidus]MCO5946961.1 hypothetical protein [Mucilaginibacter flavidus]
MAFGAFAQPEIFQYHKIEDIAKKETRASQFFQKLDSLKKTRQPHDSNVDIYFDRDVDFGYRHERISVTLNSWRYQVDLLTKNDSIYSTSVRFDDDLYNNFYSKRKFAKVDTLNSLRYLSLRNAFYGSNKSLADLHAELNIAEEYASRCGDGSPMTHRWKKLQTQAKDNSQKKFLHMLQSFCCEEQEYGLAGFKLIEKSGKKVPRKIDEIIKHIESRKSDLVICAGCLILVERQLKK